MAAINTYATLAEFKAYKTARGQSLTTSAGDDAVIEQLLESASRYVDNQTGRVFYPFIQTRTYDTPDTRELSIDTDLLEVLAVTNGDGNTLSASDFYLFPKNTTPARSIKIYETSQYYWTTNPNNSAWEQAISLLAIFGYHNDYNRNAWKVGSTLNEDLDASEVEFDVTSETLFAAGQLIRYGNELSNVLSTATGKVTVVSRGANGSTAATHTTGIPVYIWQPMADLKNNVCEMVKAAYGRRFGESGSNEVTITGAGVVLSPRDVPAMANQFIQTHRNIT